MDRPLPPAPNLTAGAVVLLECQLCEVHGVLSLAAGNSGRRGDESRGGGGAAGVVEEVDRCREAYEGWQAALAQREPLDDRSQRRVLAATDGLGLRRLRRRADADAS